MPTLDFEFTPIADEVLDALLTANLSKREWLVVMAVARLTWGNGNQKLCPIGNGLIERKTGLARPHVSTTLRALEARNIVLNEPGDEFPMRGINPRPSLWITQAEGVTKAVQGGYQNGNKTLPKRYSGVTNLGTVKKQENIDAATARASCASGRRLWTIQSILVNEFGWQLHDVQIGRAVPMLREWADVGVTDEQIRDVCQGAVGRLGQRPNGPLYYRDAMQDVMRGNGHEKRKRFGASRAEQFDAMLGGLSEPGCAQAIEGEYSRE